MKLCVACLLSKKSRLTFDGAWSMMTPANSMLFHRASHAFHSSSSEEVFSNSGHQASFASPHAETHTRSQEALGRQMKIIREL